MSTDASLRVTGNTDLISTAATASSSPPPTIKFGDVQDSPTVLHEPHPKAQAPGSAMKKRPAPEGVADTGKSSISEAEETPGASKGGSSGGESVDGPAPSNWSPRSTGSAASEWPDFDDNDDDDRFCKCLDGWLPECVINLFECIFSKVHSWFCPEQLEPLELQEMKWNHRIERELGDRVKEVNSTFTITPADTLHRDVFFQFGQVLEQIRVDWKQDKSPDQRFLCRAILVVSFTLQDKEHGESAVQTIDDSSFGDHTNKNIRDFVKDDVPEFYQRAKGVTEYRFSSFDLYFIQIRQNHGSTETGATIKHYSYNRELPSLQKAPEYKPKTEEFNTKLEFGAAIEQIPLLIKHHVRAEDFDFVELE